MPFKSQAQRREMFANQPDVAHRWAKETSNIKSLPEKVSKNKVAPKKGKKSKSESHGNGFHDFGRSK